MYLRRESMYELLNECFEINENAFERHASRQALRAVEIVVLSLRGEFYSDICM